MDKNHIKSFILLLVTVLLAACDFEEKNIDPNNSTSIDPGALLTYTQLNTCTGGNTKNLQVGICMMVVQQTASLKNTEAGVGDKYYHMGVPATSFFLDYYSSAIKNWRDMEVIASTDPKYENQLGVAKIWGSYLFQRVTDLYGNVPYSEAGMGYHAQIYKPAYDTQESIYRNMIEEVKNGIALLSADKPAVKGDLFYNGDIEKWKKFGNSLLLRLGMRLCKVDPALAQATVQTALQGGILTEAEDICMVRHIADGRDYDKNPLSLRFQKDDYVGQDAVKISRTFMDYLKQTHDPRLTVYCSLKNGDTTPEKQLGLPNGYDTNTITSIEGFAGQENYSNFNIATILQLDAPTIFLTPSESALLHAEAVLRGWVQGDASRLFDRAITLSMKEQKEAYGVEIPEEAVNAFLAQELFDRAESTEDKLEVLGCQYWVATFMNGFESYANWRRCGYPKLQPTHYAGNDSNGEIPRRLTYATDEYTINRAHVEEAVRQQGADNVNTRVWWDK